MNSTPAEVETPPKASPFSVLPEEDEAPTTDERAATPDLDLARGMLREMKRVRILDSRMTTLQRQGRVAFYGACTGQEAVPVAAGFVLAEGDWVFPALRESSIMLIRGFPLDRYIAQIYGNELDVCKGRQMPSHMSGRQVRQVSWSSCIGTQLPQAVGLAWAAKMRRDPAVVLAFLGDGATSTSEFHGALNFAGVFRVPVVLVCQNNQLAISVPVSRQTASSSMAIKAETYGIAASIVDGNDVLAVHGALAEAVARARDGGGPAFLECLTYRMAPHSSSDDPSRYRSDEEVERWRKRDPIDRLRRFLQRLGAWSEQDESLLDAALHSEVSAAIAQNEGQNPPDLSSMFDDVYAQPPWHLVEEREHLLTKQGPPVGQDDESR